MTENTFDASKIVGGAELMKDCSKPPFIDVESIGLKYTMASRHLYRLLQSVPAWVV